MLSVMWTSTTPPVKERDWVPNHFAPLLPEPDFCQTGHKMKKVWENRSGLGQDSATNGEDLLEDAVGDQRVNDEEELSEAVDYEENPVMTNSEDARHADNDISIDEEDDPADINGNYR